MIIFKRIFHMVKPKRIRSIIFSLVIPYFPLSSLSINTALFALWSCNQKEIRIEILPAYSLIRLIKSLRLRSTHPHFTLLFCLPFHFVLWNFRTSSLSHPLLHFFYLAVILGRQTVPFLRRESDFCSLTWSDFFAACDQDPDKDEFG